LEPIENRIDITEGGLVLSPNENNRRAQAFRKLASTIPPAGTNVVIITHKPNILDAFGKDWFDVKEGAATIFTPDGSGYKLLAGGGHGRQVSDREHRQALTANVKPPDPRHQRAPGAAARMRRGRGNRRVGLSGQRREKKSPAQRRFRVRPCLIDHTNAHAGIK
jgi:hypothetical protein